jgi:nitric oxide reductase NorD protein
MAYVTKRKNLDDEILLLLPLPLYTRSRIYYEEDLEEMGLGRVLDGYGEEERQSVLHQAAILSSVQPELAFHFLRNFQALFEHLPPEDLGKWVAMALDLYDQGGLNPAIDFVLAGEAHPLFRLRWGKGVALQDVHGVLLHYLHGLGKEEIGLQGGRSLYTDFNTIYVPERVRLFREREPNFILYKIMVTHKLAQIKHGTFSLQPRTLTRVEESLRERYRKRLPPNKGEGLSRFFDLFPEPRLTRDLFLLFDTARIEQWMALELPGLHRDLTSLKPELARRRSLPSDLPARSRVIEGLIRWWFSGVLDAGSNETVNTAARVIADSIQEARKAGSNDLVAEWVEEAYKTMDSLPGSYRPVEPIPYSGEIRPEEAERGRLKRRESLKTRFRQELTDLLCRLPEPQEVRIELPPAESGENAASTPQRQEVPRDLLLDGNPVPLSEGLRKTIEEIIEDLGSIPASYFAVTQEMSGHCFKPIARQPDPGETHGTPFAFSEDGEGVHALKEWDHRRQGYRKRWALLRECVSAPGDLRFAEETLARYGGMVRQIKRKFERIRLEQKLLRRQKEGDEVDLDAAVEAYNDRRAGISPSEGLYLLRSRRERNIATAFLIDLSGSTSGWINDMERAALLILSEAMQVLRDRFAIYGFSGRTRKRCELFRIKGFDEPYGDAVKRRIANLRALEYTRLGPPIRYLTDRLNEVEARTRLLITLSDGKPDDYDGYSGDYGIEDTRQALIEAKRSGIRPFCITIDKAEHSYLAHMYGPANYIFIDELTKLPLRLPEIYRKLTT